MASSLRFVVPIVLAVVAEAGSSILHGEDGKEVAGCKCKGSKGTHGHCSYHLNVFSDDENPWCRTMHNCGHQSIRGSWAYCDKAGVERRRANDGNLYDSKGFRDFYGKGKDGGEKWKAAKPFVERRVARNDKAYTSLEFRSYYIDTFGEEGWVEKWKEAKPEARKADDGKEYKWEDFLSYYGKTEAWSKWEAAVKLTEEL